jgi:hypothetical protein
MVAFETIPLVLEVGHERIGIRAHAKDTECLMRNADDDAEALGGELKAACEHMTRELIEGVHHGFFEMNVKVEMMQSKKKCVTIVAGKSNRFVV